MNSYPGTITFNNQSVHGEFRFAQNANIDGLTEYMNSITDLFPFWDAHGIPSLYRKEYFVSFNPDGNA